MSCGVGHRHGSDPTLLWLWLRPEATPWIRSLAWEPPYAAGAALKRHTFVFCFLREIYVYLQYLMSPLFQSFFINEMPRKTTILINE